jgi:hypothetical protein
LGRLIVPPHALGEVVQRFARGSHAAGRALA